MLGGVVDTSPNETKSNVWGGCEHQLKELGSGGLCARAQYKGA